MECKRRTLFTRPRHWDSRGINHRSDGFREGEPARPAVVSGQAPPQRSGSLQVATKNVKKRLVEKLTLAATPQTLNVRTESGPSGTPLQTGIGNEVTASSHQLGRKWALSLDGLQLHNRRLPAATTKLMHRRSP
jgi:hypothetical protein